MTLPAKTAEGDIIESVIAKGDLGKLTPQERTTYYVQLCKSLGLNPHTQPFAYLTLSGKLTLYAKRDAADQLRKIHGISIAIISQEQKDGLLSIHVKATDRDGRSDEDLGVIPFPDVLKGEARSNAVMKAITKAKRRVTLSISGLGFLDESEVETIPGAKRSPPTPAPNVMVPHDAETGEVIEESPPATITSQAATTAPSPSHTHVTDDGAVPDDEAESDRIMQIDDRLEEAAEKGTAELKKLWMTLTTKDREALKGALDGRHKPRAEAVDAARND
jgi:hypothetical protein